MHCDFICAPVKFKIKRRSNSCPVFKTKGYKNGRGVCQKGVRGKAAGFDSFTHSSLTATVNSDTHASCHLVWGNWVFLPLPRHITMHDSDDAQLVPSKHLHRVSTSHGSILTPKNFESILFLQFSEIRIHRSRTFFLLSKELTL